MVTKDYSTVPCTVTITNIQKMGLGDGTRAGSKKELNNKTTRVQFWDKYVKVALEPAKVIDEEFTATEGQTVFTLTAETAPEKVLGVTVDGVANEFTYASGKVTLAAGVTAGSKVVASYNEESGDVLKIKVNRSAELSHYMSLADEGLTVEVETE